MVHHSRLHSFMCRQGILKVGCKSNAFSVLYARLLGGVEERDVTETLASSLREHEERRNALRDAIMSEINSRVPGGDSLSLLEYIDGNPVNDSSAINENLRNRHPCSKSRQ